MKKRRILSALLAFITAAGTAMGAASVATAAESPYKDVSTKRWSFDEIMYATENGYMNGKGGGLFAPEETMTRAMVVTVLYRFQGEPEVTFQPRFTDVKAKDWYSSAIMWAAENGIVNGVETDKFAPMEDVTRQQLAAILMRYAPMECIKDDSRKDIAGYKDYKKVQAYARDAMSWANATGLITGVTTTTLEPAKGATREQFAVILKRFKEGAGFDYELVYNAPSGYSTYTEKEYPLVTDADIYVAVDGNDANKGTLDKPIATFERAVELVRELKKTAKDEIVVAFKSGNYGRLNVTLTEEDSGTADVPIRYCAYGDGDVIFQNGITLEKDDFVELDEDDKAFFVAKYTDKIKKVELASLLEDGDVIDTSSQLVNNGQRMNPARYPNKSTMGYGEQYLTDPVDPYDGVCGVKLTYPYVQTRFKNYHTFEGTELIGYLAHPYMCNVQQMSGYDPETNVITFTEWPFQGTGNYTNQSTFFSNISEELDNVYEYWVDTDGKTLYVFEPDTDYVLTTRGNYITTSADYVSFVGFEFCGSSDGFFDIDSDHVTVKLCDMYVGAGKFAVMATGRAITVSECELSYLAGGGIFLEDSLDAINNVIPCESVIDNNSIHDFELRYKVYLPAVRLYNTVGAVVSHNELYNASHSAVILAHAAEGNVYMPDKAGGRGIDNIIEYNVFKNLLKDSGDCGAIYSDRSVSNRDNIVRYNIFSSIEDGSGAQMGIYYGDALSGQQIYGNIFYDAGTEGIRADGRDNTIRDNVFIRKTSYQTSCQSLFVKAKYRGMYLGGGNPSIDNLSKWTWPTYYNSFSEIPAEGTAARKIWEERWPTLVKMKVDLSRAEELADDIDFIINPSYNVIKNNYTFSSDVGHTIDDDVYLFSTVENNLEFSLDENPLFTNPARGDYSIREDADFFKIPFCDIGRY